MTQNPIFQLIVYLKHLRNYDKPIYGLKKPKNHPKNKNQPEIKNQPEFRYVFSWILKVLTNIDHFGGLN